MQKGIMIDKGAIFSEDRKYRYTLTRTWFPGKSYVCFCGLNPSDADENIDDHTVTRCIRFAGSWGYGGLIMVNAFAFQSKNPNLLYTVEDPVGPQNDFWLKKVSADAGITIMAWGTKGGYMNRDKEVIKLLTNPHYLALTKEGYPRHPLYLRADLKPRKREHIND